jgi:hypothetical protein
VKRSGIKRGKPLTRNAPLRAQNRPLRRSEPLGRTNGSASGSPAQNGSKRAERRRRAPKRWRDGHERVCAVAGCTVRRGLHLHHVIHAQHVEWAGGDVWDPRNRMVVCEQHHADHHARVCPLSLADVPTSAFAFARDLLGGPTAYEYLLRRYAIAPSAAVLVDSLLREA